MSRQGKHVTLRCGARLFVTLCAVFLLSLSTAGAQSNESGKRDTSNAKNDEESHEGADEKRADSPGSSPTIRFPSNKVLKKAVSYTPRDYTLPSGKQEKSKSVVFIVDDGPALTRRYLADGQELTRSATVKVWIKSFLKQLGPQYDVNIVNFDGTTVFGEAPVANNDDQKKKAEEWIDQLKGQGKGSVSTSLKAAIDARVDRVIIIANGPVRGTTEDESGDSWLSTKSKAWAGEANLPQIDVVGIGLSQSDSKLLRSLSNASSGIYSAVGSPLKKVSETNTDKHKAKPQDQPSAG